LGEWIIKFKYAFGPNANVMVITRARTSFDKLCAETPTKKETCQRIYDNQERHLEMQQKCLFPFDRDRQQAIEHAGDIIRELTRDGCLVGYTRYLDEKYDRLGRELKALRDR